VSGPQARSLEVAILGAVSIAGLVAPDAGIECRRIALDAPGNGVLFGGADVLIVDLDGEDGVGTIARVADPELATVIVAISRDPARAMAALAAGASDFALFPRDRDWLREVLLRERDRRRGSPVGSEAGGSEAGRVDGPYRLVVEIPAAGMSFEEYERRIVEHALSRAGWNRSRAARELEISRPRLLRKIDRHGLEEPPHEPPSG
jgi:DNA-binding NtrC family response regulator